MKYFFNFIITGFKKTKTTKSFVILTSFLVFIFGYQNCGDNGQESFSSNSPAPIILLKGLSADSVAKKSKRWDWSCNESNGKSLTCTYRFVVNQSDTHEFTNEPYGNQTSYTKSDGTGTFWLHVQAKDETGLESDVKSISARLDNTKPTVRGLSNDHVTKMSKTWKWGCNDETSPSCTYRFAVTTSRNHSFDNLSYGITANHSITGGQGTYYLHVQAKDEAGNESEMKSVSVNLDNTKPVITGLANNAVPAQSTTWTWNCDKAPCTYRFVVNSSSSHSFSSSDAYRTMPSPTTSKTSGTGTFWLHVQAKDEIGNESSVVSVSALLDNTFPRVTGLSNDSSPRQSKTWTWGCSKSNCTYRFVINKSATHTFQSTSNYGSTHTKTVDTRSHGTGTFYLHVQAKDAINNESSVESVSVILNDTPLTVTGLSSDPTPSKSKTWTWGCSESPASNCTYRFVINKSATHTFSNTAYGSTTTVSKNSGNGTYTLHVQAKSAVKGESVVESVSFNLDNTSPTLTGLVNDPTVQASKTWRWDCSEISPSSCEYRFVINKSATHTFSNKAYGSATTASQSSGDGTYYLHVQARDTAGNVSNVKSVSVTLDSSGPEVTGLADDSTPTRSKRWTWSCNEASGCTYRYAVNKSPAHSFPANKAYGSATTASQSSGDGTYYLHVQARDTANNESSVVSVSVVLDNTGPSLTGLADDSTPTNSKTWNWLCSNNEDCTYRYHISQCETSPPADNDSCMTHTFASESYDANTKTASQTGDGTYYLHVQARDTAGNESQVASVSTQLYAVIKALADGPGGYHNCVLFTNNTVKCWGRNNYGQLGQGDTDNRGDNYSEVGKADLASINFGTKSDGTKHTAKAVSVGGDHSCAILDDDKVKCWGRNDYGQLGKVYDRANKNLGDDSNEMGDSLLTIDLGAKSDGTKHTAKVISAGNYHSCAILDNDKVKCWGRNNYGQLGKVYNPANRNLGDDSSEMGDSLLPIDLGTKSDGTKHTAKVVSVGGDHSCAILDDDKVKCWGRNNYGQLGQGHTLSLGDNPNEMGDNISTVKLGTGRTAKAISAGHYHSCAVLDNDEVKCWGYNGHGQLGLGNTQTRGNASTHMGDNLSAVKLGTGRTAKAISAANHQSCAILDNDKVKCWGYNGYGQLGQDNTTGYGSHPNYIGNGLPVINIGGNDTAKAISTGFAHSCAILSNDKVKCWGLNNYGQLGQGDRQTVGNGNRNGLMEDLVEIPLW